MITPKHFLLLTAIVLQSIFVHGSEVKQLSSVQFKQIIAKNDGILLDVRTEQEFKSGHIENSGQLNFYARDFAQHLLLLPKDKPIYLYCNTGRRSNIAANFLIRNGYTQVYNLQRGIVEWLHLGLPVTVSPMAQTDTRDRFNPQEFRELISTDQLVFVDFYAPWCGPCMQMMPMINDLKERYEGKIQIVKINADASRQLMSELRLTTIPYLALFQNGRLLFDHRGLIEEHELSNKLDLHYDRWRNSQ